jgi:hypothetical protein
MFKVGQKIVCIADVTDHSWSNAFYDIKGPNKHEIVEISGITPRGRLNLAEYPAPGFPLHGYNPKWFRPLASEGIEEMLNEVLKEAAVSVGV